MTFKYFYYWLNIFMYSSLIIGCLYFAQNLGLWYDELEWSLRIVYKKSILETLQHLA